RRYARRLPRAPARGHALDAARGRHEHLGTVARATGRGRTAAARGAGRRRLSARPLFRGVAKRARSAAVEFRGPNAGGNPRGPRHSGKSRKSGIGELGAQLRAFARDGLVAQATSLFICRGERTMFAFANEFWTVNVGHAEMLKGGVIMDVTNADQAKIAEDAGASAVMALERVPSDIRKEGGVARMANISIIEEIMRTVTIPVM